MFFKNIQLQPFPFYIYASWYQRADDAWVFGGDNNYKTFEYSTGGESDGGEQLVHGIRTAASREHHRQRTVVDYR